MANQRLVKQAQSWLGTTQGSANHSNMLRIYNTQNPLPVGYRVTSTDAWCAAFVSTCLVECDIKGAGTECSCPRWIRNAKASGIYHAGVTGVEVGDVLFYDWDGDAVSDHVGIVEEVQSSSLKVIEGNMSGGVVGRRSINTSYPYILGYIKTPSETTPTPTPTQEQTTQEVGDLKIYKTVAAAPDWAKPLLTELVEREIISDANDINLTYEGVRLATMLGRVMRLIDTKLTDKKGQ